MVITVVYQDLVIRSKVLPDCTDEYVKEVAEELYSRIMEMDKMTLETPDGYAIIPEAVLRNSIIFVDK